MEHFHCDGDQNLGGIALAPLGTDWVYPVTECKVGLIELNFPMEQFSVRANQTRSSVRVLSKMVPAVTVA